jgi:hypothetical protein
LEILDTFSTLACDKQLPFGVRPGLRKDENPFDQ